MVFTNKILKLTAVCVIFPISPNPRLLLTSSFKHDSIGLANWSESKNVRSPCLVSPKKRSSIIGLFNWKPLKNDDHLQDRIIQGKNAGVCHMVSGNTRRKIAQVEM